MQRASDGATPIHLATKAGHVDVVKILAAKGASIDAIDRSGNSPLHLAVIGGPYDVVDCLLKSGANRKIRNHAGKTPIDLAKDKAVRDLLKSDYKGSTDVDSGNVN